jgi:GT2 family glycosyltransferase
MSSLQESLTTLLSQAKSIKTTTTLRDRQMKPAIARLAETELASRRIDRAFRKTRIGNPKYFLKRNVISKSGLFDWEYYYSGNAGLMKSFANPIDHYLTNPVLPGVNPHPLFDGQWYLERNPDVAQKGTNPLYHYIRFGAKERRSPHPLFDANLYLRLNPDVAASGINPLVHYIRYGGVEGRRPHWLFDATAYLNAFPELLDLGMSPLEHYCRYGVFLSFRPHRHFDPDFYLDANPDVLAAGINPLLHYLRCIAAEMRDPAADFSTEAYRNAYPEVKASGENPLVHYASWADYERVLLSHVDHEPPPPPSAHQNNGKQPKLPPISLNAEPPTQRLQDFLYDEFGLGERSRIVFGLQRFLLPLNADLRQPTPIDDDLAELAGTVGAMAELIPVSAQPDVSIIVPVYNQVRFTLACLYSVLACNTKFTFEVIVADDCSSDATREIFAQGLHNIRHVRSATNIGFLRNCNNAARSAKGRVIVFLNNDTYVLPGWLDHLIETLDADSDIGIVGSKLIFSDGRLQESGGLIFADGSGWNYGRFDDPRKPQYCYLRDSDYVSGASIAISSELWKNLGGFDERYEMAYYEDTDLAFQVRQAGKRVVVQPLSQLIHFEGASSGTDLTAGVKRYQVVNRETFRRRWAETIAGFGLADPNRLPIHRGSKGTILVIDARTPTPDRDSGSMDTYQYLRILKSFGYHVVFAPQNLVHAGHYSAELQRIGVQVLYAPYWMSFDQILSAVGASLDYVLIYRVPVAEAVYDIVRSRAPQAKIIFDAVDLHFLRLAREAELAGDEEKKLAAERMKLVELNMIRKADATIVLSRFEMDLLKKLVPDAALFEIPIVRQVPPPRTKGFDERRDMVFVGGFEHIPNVDAVQWFVAEVMPRLQARGFTGRFVVVGSSMPPEIKALARPGVIIRGFVADLEEFFSEIRLSIAPLRYGAGLKGKVITSLSYGVPVVATTVAVEGGGFSTDVNVLVADKPDELAEAIMRVYEDVELWEQISCAGYQYFKETFSIEAVAGKLAKLFSPSRANQ